MICFARWGYTGHYGFSNRSYFWNDFNIIYYFSSLPEELFKAARVDGAGFWSILFRVMLPMSIPIFTVAAILQITGIWNDFLFGVVFTGPEAYPMTAQLNSIVN